jgi:hypothetical protein
MKSILVMIVFLIAQASASADSLGISRKDVSCTLKSLTDSTSETLFIPRPDLKIGEGEGGTGFQGLVFESRNLPGHRLGVTVSGNLGTMVDLNLTASAKSSVTIYDSGEAVVELNCTPSGLH